MTAESRRGAPRSEVARVAILDAAAAQFAERGWENLTIEGIAAAAHVGKQTIYRWWPSRSALIAECLIEERLIPGSILPLDTGDVRGDLSRWLEAVFHFVGQPGNESLMRSLLAVSVESPEVGRRLHERLGAGSALTTRLETAVRIGQLRADAPIAEMGDTLVGAILLRAVTWAATPRPGASMRLVDMLLDQNIATP